MKLTNEDRFFIRQTIIEFFLYAIVATIPFLAIAVDLFYFDNIINEESVVEGLQDVFIIITIGLFSYNAKRFPQLRQGFVLMAGFFLCILIRESDNIFDRLTGHGSWFYFAITAAIICIGYALTNRQATFDALVLFIKSREYAAFLGGLVIVFISSRLLGTGSIWKHILQEGYVITAKHIVEEGSELFGYAIMCISVWTFNRKLTTSLKLEK
ncbi:hypothetical protein FW755_09755 [Lonepinella koalarum]|uniref:hypothetical protein n=1 Tax=Lonepinella koalarum TaxID=53417 RepID=UPI0011E4B068|nr:hypothetical protein [Lonepinella koalarum]TYG35346.1 hypothetical protein FW755_09755 [Lonepinella koalarum]